MIRLTSSQLSCSLRPCTLRFRTSVEDARLETFGESAALLCSSPAIQPQMAISQRVAELEHGRFLLIAEPLDLCAMFEQ
jgi:hypothetical protein